MRRKNDSVKFEACIGAPVRYTGTKPSSLIAKERRENASTGILKEERVGTRGQAFGEKSKERERERESARKISLIGRKCSLGPTVGDGDGVESRK